MPDMTATARRAGQQEPPLEPVPVRGLHSRIRAGPGTSVCAFDDD